LASASDDQTVRIWDPATGQARYTLTGHTSEVWALAVALDGRWLASAGYDGTVRIWEPGSGQARAPPPPNGSHRRGGGVDGGPGRPLAGLRRLRRDGADLGSGHRAGPP